MSRKRKTPEQQVDEFLAAPETLLRSQGELQKARQRKAREKARDEQLRASKLKTAPSVEDLLADIIRVADDRETNPFAEFRSVSRRRYELYGHYPISAVDQMFGQFSHALEAAGLRDQPGDRLWRANRTRESRRQHAERYLKRYVHPYVVTEPEPLTRDSYLLLSISDTHSQFLCPFVWRAFKQAIRDLKPDGLLFNGDVLEGAELSNYPKIPGWTRPLQEELDFTRVMFEQVREIHDGDIYYTGGNHGIDRLAAYLTRCAPVLVGLREPPRIDQMLGLADLDIKLLQGGTIASPAGTEDAKPGFLLFGFYRIHHGTKLGLNPAQDELRAAGRSGQSGHVHRASLAFGTTERDEGLSWMVTPMGCRHEAGRAYVKSPNTGWQRGFGVARLFPNGTVHQYPVVVSGTPERITVEGFTYERPKNLRDPLPEGVWLSE